MTRTIAIIAAVAANGAIGYRGGIPWDSPEDRRIFADKTAGGVLVCGWHTAENLAPILEKNRRGRDLVSITDGLFYCFDWTVGDSGFYSKDFYSIEAIASAYPDRNVWICGGSRLYAEAMRHPLVTEMHLSFMDCEPDADAFFPRFNFMDRDLDTIRTGWDSFWRNVDTIPGTGFAHLVYRRI